MPGAIGERTVGALGGGAASSRPGPAGKSVRGTAPSHPGPAVPLAATPAAAAAGRRR